MQEDGFEKFAFTREEGMCAIEEVADNDEDDTFGKITPLQQLPSPLPPAPIATKRNDTKKKTAPVTPPPAPLQSLASRRASSGLLRRQPSEPQMTRKRGMSLPRNSLDLVESANVKLLALEKSSEEHLDMITAHRSRVVGAVGLHDDESLSVVSSALDIEQNLVATWSTDKKRLELSPDEQLAWAAYVRRTGIYDVEERRKRFLKTVEAAMRPRYDIRLLSEKGLETAAKLKMESREAFLADRAEQEAQLQSQLANLEEEHTALHKHITPSSTTAPSLSKVHNIERYIHIKEDLIPDLQLQLQHLLDQKPPELTKKEESAWRGIEAKRKERTRMKDVLHERENTILKAKRAFLKAAKPTDYRERHAVRIKQAFEKQTGVHYHHTMLHLKHEIKSLTRGSVEVDRLLSYHTAEECEEKLFLLEWKLKLEEQKAEVERYVSHVNDMLREDALLAELDENERVVERSMTAEAWQKEHQSDKAFLETMADLKCLEPVRDSAQKAAEMAHTSPWEPPTYPTGNMTDGGWLGELKKALIAALHTASDVALPRKLSAPDARLFYLMNRSSDGYTSGDDTFALLQEYMHVIGAACCNRRKLFALICITGCIMLGTQQQTALNGSLFPIILAQEGSTKSERSLASLKDKPRPLAEIGQPLSTASLSPKGRSSYSKQKPIKKKKLLTAPSLSRLLGPETPSIITPAPVQWCPGGTVQIPQLMKAKEDRDSYLNRLSKKEKALGRRQKELLKALKESREERYR